MHLRPIAAHIPAGKVWLEGTLALPPQARGVVAFVHGSGSSRSSPRNVYVAETLQESGIATLLFDLLTRVEDRDYDMRFNIALLTERLLAAIEWMQKQPDTQGLPLGLFGASTGAAAALRAAAKLGEAVCCVVSRGGRPDLAGIQPLEKVVSPTLLIVGGNDDVVIELNQQAFERLAGDKQLVIVPDASHLFEEPGTLEQVAQHATQWFLRCFETRTAHGEAPR